MFYLICTEPIVENQSNVRIAHYSGDTTNNDGFYEKDPEILSNNIAQLLAENQIDFLPVEPNIMITPHAGYKYSGSIAAKNFSLLKGKKYDTVIIVGPYHNVPFKGAGFWKKGIWKTPLGDVSIDEELTKKIMSQDKSFLHTPDMHNNEHSIEVQLPFLQTVLENFKIVPILIRDEASAEKLADAIIKAQNDSPDKKFLVLSTTDLSHYHPPENAERLDQKTLVTINRRNIKNITRQELCGDVSVQVALFLAQKMGNQQHEILAYKPSEPSPENGGVVGYSSVVFYDAPLNNPYLNTAQRLFLEEIAYKTLEQFLTKYTYPQYQITDPALLVEKTVFVTLRDKHSNELMGCVSATGPLYKSVQESAVNSAIHDNRFQPMHANQLKDVKVSISVLNDKRPITSIDEIVFGVHGVQVENGGVFLPSVANEVDWSKIKFLEELCTQKSGLDKNCWKFEKLLVFSDQEFPDEDLTLTDMILKITHRE